MRNITILRASDKLLFYFLVIQIFRITYIIKYNSINYNFSQPIFYYKNINIFNFLFFRRDWDFIPYFTFVYIQMSCLLGHKNYHIYIMSYSAFEKNQTKNAQILSLKLKHF